LNTSAVVLLKDVLEVEYFACPPPGILLIYAGARKELPLVILETIEAFIPIVEKGFIVFPSDV
jgi:hypothetical protein